MPLPRRTQRAALRRCHISEDLEAVTRIGPEAPPGPDVPEQAVAELWSRTRTLYRTGMYPALQLCIRRRGRVVVDRVIGFARGAGPERSADARLVPARLDTPFQLFSASKPLAAMLVHKLDEQRLVHLEDPVCAYIPEFGRHGKEQITIRHLLSHRAGIQDVPLSAVRPDLLAEPDRVLALLCDARPRSRPGHRLAYHAITAGFVIGELVRRVTGVSFAAAFDARFGDPLEARTLRFGATPRELSQVVHNSATGLRPPRILSRAFQRILGLELDHAIEFSNQRAFLEAEVPSANALATARDVAAFYQCLLDDGLAGSKRLLEASTIRRALLPQSFGEIDRAIGVPLRLSAGFVLGCSKLSPFGRNSPRSFGHPGLTNNLTWADPERDLVVALLTNGQPLLGPHVPALMRWVGAIGRLFPKLPAHGLEDRQRAA